jgi:hypothetical protein
VGHATATATAPLLQFPVVQQLGATWRDMKASDRCKMPLCLFRCCRRSKKEHKSKRDRSRSRERRR